jgi:hypothetical protein
MAYTSVGSWIHGIEPDALTVQQMELKRRHVSAIDTLHRKVAEHFGAEMR